MKIWSRDEIACRWAPAFLYGPTVSTEHALEFIRRTDPGLCGDALCNDRMVERELAEMIGGPHGTDHIARWKYIEAYKLAFGHISLEHLRSQWVAAPHVIGPHGPVHPNGDVHFVTNFGKYASVDEIERDLDALKVFDWLSFRLYVWDSYEERAEADPDFGWSFDRGRWQRTTKPPKEVRREPDIREMVTRTIFMPPFARECTWSVGQIKQMWGDKIEAAKMQAEQSLTEVVE